VSDSQQATWTFFTNHGHVLLCLAADPDITVREVAARVGITERATIRIIGELEEGGVLERTREGRRNHYTINEKSPLRHELEKHCDVGDLIKMVGEPQRA
jgi:DNA-binding MarR family transcriptional regulator